MTEEIKKRYEEENRPKALRFLVPEGETTFEDLIHGNIKKNNDEIEDFVIMKSDGTPTYNLAVVIDDYMMGITHTIRGEDHIPNTPKQILLYRALGFTPPKFAHLPLILGKDKSKLSKRHGATSVTQYRNDGFLPEALFNFLALLGWSPGGDREIMTKEEMIESFSLDRISKKAAVFDLEKLEWMNGVYINAMSNDELLERLIPLLLKKGWVDDKTINEKKDYLINFVTLLKTRMRRLTDFIRYGTYFFEDIKNYEEKGIRKYFGKDTSLYLEKLNGVLQRVNDFSKENLENIFRELSETIGIKPAKLIHPVRLAVTGLTVGPGLFDILEVLGKKIVINRLTKAIKYIKIYFNNENGAIV